MKSQVILAPGYEIPALTNPLKRELAVSGPFIEKRDELLESVKGINPATMITTADRDAAIAKVREIKSLLSAVENDRKEFKKPFFEMGKLIDATAKAFVEKLESERVRLESTLGKFEEDRQRRFREEQQKALQGNAIKRIEISEKIEEIKASPKSDLEKELEAQELEEARQQLDFQSLHTAQDYQNQALAKSDKQDFTVEIEVFDIKFLYEKCPQAVKLEPVLGEIRKMIDKGITNIPGVRFTKIPVVRVKKA